MCILATLSFRERPFRRSIVLICGAALVSFCASAAARDLDEEPVALRLSLALERVSTFSDTIGRSASVAHPLGSSVNPASYDFLREPPYDFKAVQTFTSNYATFGTDTTVTGFSTNSACRLPTAGTLSGLYIRTDSHDGESRQGDQFLLESNEFVLGYSRRLREDLSVGCSVKLTDSLLDIDDTFLGFPRETDTSSFGVDFKLGLLKALHDDWTLGLMAGVGRTRSDIDGTVLLPPPPFGPGTVAIDEKDTTDSVNLRGGIGWRPSDGLGLYADWQYLQLDSDFGSVDVGRMFLGMEALASRSLALRLGGSVDTEQNTTASAGLGFYGIKGVPVEIAYSYNAFPEVNQEFGRSHLLSVSIAILF